MSRQEPVNDRVLGFNRTALPVDPPDRILLVPWGEVHSNGTGGNHIVDAQSAAMILEAFKRREGVPLVIDYEHASEGGEYQTPTGIAPAMGWIDRLEAVPGEGIYGHVEKWTEPGANFIRTSQYRFVSWAGWTSKKDRRVAEITSVALVNAPGIVGMPPIVNKEQAVSHQPSAEGDGANRKDSTMNEIVKALGLKDGATEAECVTAVNKLRTELTAAQGRPAVAATVCKALGLAETAGEADVVAAINKAKTPPSDAVPRAEFDAVATSLKTTATELAALRERTTDREADERIASAQREGKLSAKMLEPDAAGKNHWRTLARDGAAWTACMERMPVAFPADGRVVAANSGATAGTAGDGRGAIIARAAAEFTANGEKLSRLTSQAAFVNGELIQAGHKAMTKEETEKIRA